MTFGQQHLLLDASFFMGRSFRVGWGPAWTLVHAVAPSSTDGAAAAPTRLESGGTASFPVTISALRVADHVTADAPGVAQTLEDSLKVQLEESEMDPAASSASCPEFRPKGIVILSVFVCENSSLRRIIHVLHVFHRHALKFRGTRADPRSSPAGGGFPGKLASRRRRSGQTRQENMGTSGRLIRTPPRFSLSQW